MSESKKAFLGISIGVISAASGFYIIAGLNGLGGLLAVLGIITIVFSIVYMETRQ